MGVAKINALKVVGSDASLDQRFAGSRSITINVNDPGNTGGLPLPGVPAGTGPNFAETMNTR